MPGNTSLTATTDPINPETLADLTDDQLDTLIAQKRERRLHAFEVYREAQEARREATEERLQKQLDDQLRMFANDLERVDRMLDKLDQRAMKIRGVRLEIGDM